MGTYEAEQYLAQGFSSIMAFYAVLMIISIAQAVFLALAVFNDAKSRGNKDPAMWALLSGFLGWIPAIIYLCVRDKARNRMMLCPQCGFTHAVGEPYCPSCRIQNVYAAPYFANPLAEQQKKHAKTFLILFIVTMAVQVIVVVISMSILFRFIMDAAMIAG